MIEPVVNYFPSSEDIKHKSEATIISLKGFFRLLDSI